MEFLKAILAGTYLRHPPQGEAAILFYRLATGDHDPFGEPTVNMCGECGHATDRSEKQVVGWRKNSEVFQINNCSHLHPSCASSENWFLLMDVDMDTSLTFSMSKLQYRLI